jgi:hypothetical protein
MAKGRAIVPDTRPPAKAASKPGYGRKGRSGLSRALPWIIGAAVALAVITGLVLLVQSNTAMASAPGERIPTLSRDHIQPGQAHEPYNSDPPTSGPHYPEPIPAGFYDTPQPDEAVIHNLEHGHIWIAYDCSKLTNCDAVKAQLRALVQSYNQWKIVVTPRQNKDAAIAVAAWGWLEKMNTYDEPAIRKFVDAWRDKGPEQTME